MIHNDEIISKISKALNAIKNPNISLSLSLMEYKEIAMMLEDDKAVEWAVSQLEGYTKDTAIPLNEFRKEVKEGERLVTYYEPIVMLENEVNLRYDMSDTTMDKQVRDMMLTYLGQRKAAISLTLNWVRQQAHTWLIHTLLQAKSIYLPEIIFDEIRNFVDDKIKKISPDIVERFATIFDDLSSTNQTKWANATLSCREVFRILADKLQPVADEINSTGEHKLGSEDYRNRLIELVKQKSESDTFKEVFSSNLNNLIDRLESIFRASCKGKSKCENIVEAKRTVIYTYILVADILKFVD